MSASVAAEVAHCAATNCLGPHSIIRHSQLRVFWWQSFRIVEEVPWDTFWASFPKALDQCVTLFAAHSVFIAEA